MAKNVPNSMSELTECSTSFPTLSSTQYSNREPANFFQNLHTLLDSGPLPKDDPRLLTLLNSSSPSYKKIAQAKGLSQLILTCNKVVLKDECYIKKKRPQNAKIVSSPCLTEAKLFSDNSTLTCDSNVNSTAICDEEDDTDQLHTTMKMTSFDGECLPIAWDLSSRSDTGFPIISRSERDMPDEFKQLAVCDNLTVEDRKDAYHHANMDPESSLPSESSFSNESTSSVNLADNSNNSESQPTSSSEKTFKANIKRNSSKAFAEISPITDVSSIREDPFSLVVSVFSDKNCSSFSKNIEENCSNTSIDVLRNLSTQGSMYLPDDSDTSSSTVDSSNNNSNSTLNKLKQELHKLSEVAKINRSNVIVGKPQAMSTPAMVSVSQTLNNCVSTFTFPFVPHSSNANDIHFIVEHPSEDLLDNISVDGYTLEFTSASANLTLPNELLETPNLDKSHLFLTVELENPSKYSCIYSSACSGQSSSFMPINTAFVQSRMSLLELGTSDNTSRNEEALKSVSNQQASFHFHNPLCTPVLLEGYHYFNSDDHEQSIVPSKAVEYINDVSTDCTEVSCLPLSELVFPKESPDFLIQSNQNISDGTFINYDTVADDLDLATTANANEFAANAKSSLASSFDVRIHSLQDKNHVSVNVIDDNAKPSTSSISVQTEASQNEIWGYELNDEYWDAFKALFCKLSETIKCSSDEIDMLSKYKIGFDGLSSRNSELQSSIKELVEENKKLKHKLAEYKKRYHAERIEKSSIDLDEIMRLKYRLERISSKYIELSSDYDSLLQKSSMFSDVNEQDILERNSKTSQSALIHHLKCASQKFNSCRAHLNCLRDQVFFVLSHIGPESNIFDVKLFNDRFLEFWDEEQLHLLLKVAPSVKISRSHFNSNYEKSQIREKTILFPGGWRSTVCYKMRESPTVANVGVQFNSNDDSNCHKLTDNDSEDRSNCDRLTNKEDSRFVGDCCRPTPLSFPVARSKIKYFLNKVNELNPTSVLTSKKDYFAEKQIVSSFNTDISHENETRSSSGSREANLQICSAESGISSSLNTNNNDIIVKSNYDTSSLTVHQDKSTDSLNVFDLYPRTTFVDVENDISDTNDTDSNTVSQKRLHGYFSWDISSHDSKQIDLLEKSNDDLSNIAIFKNNIKSPAYDALRPSQSPISHYRKALNSTLRRCSSSAMIEQSPQSLHAARFSPTLECTASKLALATFHAENLSSLGAAACVSNSVVEDSLYSLNEGPSSTSMPSMTFQNTSPPKPVKNTEIQNGVCSNLQIDDSSNLKSRNLTAGRMKNVNDVYTTSKDVVISGTDVNQKASSELCYNQSEVQSNEDENLSPYTQFGSQRIETLDIDLVPPKSVSCLSSPMKKFASHSVEYNFDFLQDNLSNLQESEFATSSKVCLDNKAKIMSNYVHMFTSQSQEISFSGPSLAFSEFPFHKPWDIHTKNTADDASNRRRLRSVSDRIPTPFPHQRVSRLSLPISVEQIKNNETLEEVSWEFETAVNSSASSNLIQETSDVFDTASTDKQSANLCKLRFSRYSPKEHLESMTGNQLCSVQFAAHPLNRFNNFASSSDSNVVDQLSELKNYLLRHFEKLSGLELDTYLQQVKLKRPGQTLLGLKFQEVADLLREQICISNVATERHCCMICAEPYASKNTEMLKCFHIFHIKCVKRWCQVKNECPLCGVPLL